MGIGRRIAKKKGVKKPITPKQRVARKKNIKVAQEAAKKSRKSMVLDLNKTAKQKSGRKKYRSMFTTPGEKYHGSYPGGWGSR